MSSNASYLSVVRLGPDHESATLLKRSILEYFHQHQETDTSNEEEGRFQVANRYFAAQLALESILDDNKASTPNDAEPTLTQSTDGLFQKEDGIILVFDENATAANPQTSFDALHPVHDKAMSLSTPPGDLLRLVVGLSLSSGTTVLDDDEYSRRILWCLDRGYEYVPSVDLSDLTKGHDERDKEGFARIVEAIAGTVWSSAVMKPKQSQQLKASYAQEKQRQQESKEEKEPENLYVPPDPSLLGGHVKPSETQEEESKQEPTLTDEQRTELAQKALLQEDGVDTSNADNDIEDRYLPVADDDSQAPPLPSAEERAKEREQERQFDQLDSALRQAANIRELSQSGNLSDEQRRQRAGDAAMLLMNLMMGMDDDEDDEEEEEENSIHNNEDDDDPAEKKEEDSATPATAPAEVVTASS